MTIQSSRSVIIATITGATLALWACAPSNSGARQETQSTTSSTLPQPDQASASPKSVELSGEKAFVYVAGGCFWCVESDFEKLPSVYEAISGYTGGDVENPTYKQVSYTETGHYEAVKIIYDPTAVSYRALIDYHFRHIDPLDDGGQFCDRGSSYRTAIFVTNAEERKAAEAAATEASAILGMPVVTPILDYEEFWEAENYHQDYYKKNPIRYRAYRRGCGRDRRVQALWGEKPPPSSAASVQAPSTEAQ